jgi:hypothetical protein
LRQKCFQGIKNGFVKKVLFQVKPCRYSAHQFLKTVFHAYRKVCDAINGYQWLAIKFAAINGD